MILTRVHEGTIFVRTAPNVEAPWAADLCEYFAERWIARGESWAPDGEALAAAARDARAWEAAHPIECPDEEHY